MRSRAEAALRAIAVAALVMLLALVLRGARPGAERAAAASLPRELERWSTGARPGGVHANLDAPLLPAHSAWLAALKDAGVAVSWSAPGAVPVAVVADAVADPAGATRVLVAAPRGTMVVLSDDWGVLDSAAAGEQGARFLARSAPRAVTVHAGGQIAQAVAGDSLALGRVLVLGAVSWESKFVLAALEERGWQAEADLALAPRGGVVQGRPGTLDIRTHAAVIVLDSAAAPRAGAVARFASQGGGVVFAAPALSVPAFAALAAGTLGEALPAIEPFDTGFADPRRSLALRDLRPRSDAVTLERREAAVSVAVRRSGAARVAVFGYHDTWRWRLAGSGDAPEAHRDWWAGLVAAVAWAPAVPLPAAPAAEAPFARLVDQLGAPRPSVAGAAASRALQPWLFGLALAALLLEWGSRRLRGRR